MWDQKWKKEREERNRLIKEAQLREEIKGIKDQEITKVIQQEGYKNYERIINQEKEENFEKFGQRLTNREIKEMFHREKDIQSVLDNRFSSGLKGSATQFRLMYILMPKYTLIYLSVKVVLFYLEQSLSLTRLWGQTPLYGVM